MQRVTLVMCVLATLPALADFEHENPMPHALQSDFAEFQLDVDDSLGKIIKSIRSVEQQDLDANASIDSLTESIAALNAAVSELNAKCCPEPADEPWMPAIISAIAATLLSVTAMTFFGRRLLRLPNSPTTNKSLPDETTASKDPVERADTEKEPERRLRIVTASRKDKNGVILAICNHEESWRERTVEQAIDDINNGIVYEALGPVSGRRTQIRPVEPEGARPYLTTEADDEDDNNLDNLPDC